MTTMFFIITIYPYYKGKMLMFPKEFFLLNQKLRQGDFDPTDVIFSLGVLLDKTTITADRLNDDYQTIAGALELKRTALGDYTCWLAEKSDQLDELNKKLNALEYWLKSKWEYARKPKIYKIFISFDRYYKLAC